MRIPVGGSPGGARVRRRLAVGRRQRPRRVAQVDPGADKVVRRTGRERAARARVRGGGAVWVASGVDGIIRGIDSTHGGLSRLSTSAGTRARRRRRRRAVGGERGGGHGDADRPPDRHRACPDPGRQRAERGRRRRGRGVGRSTATTGRSRASIRDKRVRGRSASAATRRGRRGRGLACGWRAARRALSRASIRRGGARATPRDRERPAAIAVAGGSVWAAADATRTAHRGGTLRVRLPYQPKQAVRCSTPHWTLGHLHVVTEELQSMAYDGLVAYRRAQGVGGPTFLVALATTVPRRRGRQDLHLPAATRPRYPTVRPVRPRTSGPRSSASWCRMNSGVFPALFPAILGAGRCTPRRRRCDLSRGIETDVPARTITIHLTRPDGDLLHKLTMLFASVVPADSPRHPTTGVTPPAPGRTASSPGTPIAAGRSCATVTSDRARRARAERASQTASTSACTRRPGSSGRSPTCSGVPRISRCSRMRSRRWSLSDAFEHWWLARRGRW